MDDPFSPPEPNHPKYATSPSAGSISTISIDLTSSVSRNRKFADSPLERAGFEPSVPGVSGFDFAREVRGRFEPSVPREAAGILVISVLVRADFSVCRESSR